MCGIRMHIYVQYAYSILSFRWTALHAISSVCAVVTRKMLQSIAQHVPNADSMRHC